MVNYLGVPTYDARYEYIVLALLKWGD